MQPVVPSPPPTSSGTIPGPAKRAAIRYFGDYVLLGEIARGGMGVVYRALQTSLDREVAIKMIDAGKLASEAAVRRFHTEAEAMAKLDHPNIVSIHEIGEHDGHHYFAMNLVDGPNLAEQIGDQPVKPREAAELLVTVARAVQYAHDRGVLHRDLKPSNILLDAGGKPHVTDFGIAKLAERGAGFTGSVAMLGTPEYMAPEQAVGKVRQVGTSADIYSLGAVLYHLLTGQPPFKGETPFEILDRVLKQAPVSVRSLNPAVDPGLETICLKCLEKEPKQRYGTAEAFALDLERWLSNRPVKAQAASRWERMANIIRCHPAVAALTIVLVLAILGIAAIPTRQWSRTTKLPEHSGMSNVTVSITGKATAGVGVTDQLQLTNSAQPRTTNVVYLKTSSSGVVREQREKTSDSEQSQFFSFTGRLQRKEALYSDGTKQTTFYDLNGRQKRQEISHQDGGREVITIAYDRDGNERARELLKLDGNGKAVTKTVVAHNIGLLVNQTVTNHFDRGRFGFVYRPADVVDSSALRSWYDSYWFTSTGSPIARPFHYAWGWEDEKWYHFQQYWVADGVYPSPAHWLTDWLIAGYLVDDYATGTSAVQLRKEARLAREEAEKAKRMATSVKHLTEVTEAKMAQANAELRARTAEEMAARIEAQETKRKGGGPSTNAPRFDTRIKEGLRDQIEKMIAARKKFAGQAASGQKPPLPDLSEALADGRYTFLASKTLSVVAATDASPAGTLSAGDLLKLEPGLNVSLNEANENTFVAAKIITSKGDEVTAGTSILISLRDLQEFDSEFRARIDLGLAEAQKNNPLFRQGALNPKN